MRKKYSNIDFKNLSEIGKIRFILTLKLQDGNITNKIERETKIKFYFTFDSNLNGDASKFVIINDKQRIDFINTSSNLKNLILDNNIKYDKIMNLFK